MLNYSAAVIPVTKADKELDKRTEEYNSYQPLNPTDRKNWEACR
jgi:amidase